MEKKLKGNNSSNTPRKIINKVNAITKHQGNIFEKAKKDIKNDNPNKIFNTNKSIALKNYTSIDLEKQNNIQYKKIYPDILLNNPKKYIDIINDNCFHLEMNLKLLGFDEEYIKECQYINNISATYNPFLK